MCGHSMPLECLRLSLETVMNGQALSDVLEEVVSSITRMASIRIRIASEKMTTGNIAFWVGHGENK